MEPDNPDGTPPPPPDQPTTSSDDSNPQPTTSGGESSGTQVGTPGHADGGADGPTQPPPTIWDSPFVQDYEDDESSAPLFVDDEDDTGEISVLLAPPPISHAGDFELPVELLGANFGYSAEDYEDSEDESGEEGEDFAETWRKLWRNKDTLFGEVTKATTISESQSFLFKENREQALNAALILDNVSSTPLPEFWHTFTQWFFFIVFFANIAVAIADIIINPVHFHFKITVLVMSVIENCVVFGIWLHIKLRKVKDDDKFVKHQQYIENIVHEILIYPVLITTVVGFVNDRMYNVGDFLEDPLFWAQFVLLIGGMLELIWTQIVRMWILYQLIKDIHKLLAPESGVKGFTGAGFAGSILPRAYFTVLGNTVTFLYLIAMLGIMTYRDNKGDDATYSLTSISALTITATLIFPFYSIFLFFVANAYWVLEILICINLQVSQTAAIQESLKEEYGDVMTDAVSFAVTKSGTSIARLEDIRSLPLSKKVLYGLCEAPVILLVILWGGFMLAVCYSYEGFDTDSESGVVTDNIVRVFFVVCSFLMNYHVGLLALAVIGAVPFFLTFFALYPCFVLVCCSKKKKYINKGGIKGSRVSPV